MSFSQSTMGHKLKKSRPCLGSDTFRLQPGRHYGSSPGVSRNPGEPSRSCLWQVSSDKGTLFLLGTVHLLKPGTHIVSPAAEAAFEQAQTILLEVDLDRGGLTGGSSNCIVRKACCFRGRRLRIKSPPETLALVVQKIRGDGPAL